MHNLVFTSLGNSSKDGLTIEYAAGTCVCGTHGNRGHKGHDASHWFAEVSENNFFSPMNNRADDPSGFPVQFR